MQYYCINCGSSSCGNWNKKFKPRRVSKFKYIYSKYKFKYSGYSKNEVKQENTAQDDENKVVEEPKKTEKKEPDTEQKKVTQGEEETSSNKENTENTQEKAIELVKKEWGEDSTVYYTVDNNQNNIYTISVRSKSTTETVAEYEVDIKNKQVKMK